MMASEKIRPAPKSFSRLRCPGLSIETNGDLGIPHSRHPSHEFQGVLADYYDNGLITLGLMLSMDCFWKNTKIPLKHVETILLSSWSLNILDVERLSSGLGSVYTNSRSWTGLSMPVAFLCKIGWAGYFRIWSDYILYTVMCIYICIYIYIYVSTYMCIYIYMYLHTCVYI